MPASDDVSTLLDSIKALSEKEDAKLNSYVEYKMPLELLGKSIGYANSIETAQKVLQKDIPICTNTGTTQSLELSLELLNSEKFTSLVFDTYTVWHAAVANLLPLLRNKYELHIPASVLSNIQYMIDDYSSIPGERLAVAWQNGEFLKYETTAADHQRMIDYIRTQKSKIETLCTVNYVSWTEKPNELTTKILEVGGNHFLDSAYLALTKNMILVSEDMFFRDWANLALGSITNVWIDPILRYLNTKGLITNNELANAIVHFSSWKHTHIYLNPNILIDIYNIDDSENLHKLNAASYFIGNKNEDLMISHTLVCKAFLNEIWKHEDKKINKTLKATNLVLESLLRFSNSKGFYLLLICIDSITELEEYLVEWREQHGISDSELEAAYTKLTSGEEIIFS